MTPAMRRALLVAAPVATFLVATARWLPPIPVAGSLAVFALAVLAAARPLVAAPLGLALVALAPVYWGRGLGGFAVAVIPITVTGVVLLPAAVRERERLQFVGLDVAVATYIAFRSVALLLNFSTGPGAAVGFASRVIVAYAAFRLLGLVPGMRRRLAGALVGSAVVLAVASRFEAGGNWFFTALPQGYQATAWARPELRFGVVRGEASFGHPIAFGLFLAVTLVLIAGVAVTSQSGRTRMALAAGALVMLAALVDTLSRGPLLVAAVAMVAWAVLERRHVTGTRLVVAGLAATALVVLTPALIAIGALWSSSSGDTNEARSAEYRLQVAALLADPDEFSLLGRATALTSDVTASVSDRVGLKSLDNEYALIYVGGGALSLAAFVWVALSTVAVALRRGLDPVDRAWAVATGAVTLGLSTVALLTQFADLFWVAVALTAAMSQADRKAPAPAPFHSGSLEPPRPLAASPSR